MRFLVDMPLSPALAQWLTDNGQQGVHVAMSLQARGRANALRALLKTQQKRGLDFLHVANALSVSYPKGTEEKRLADAVLLAVPR